ncbi:MAG: N-acetyltransferase [Phycisphaerae bacterium]|nr:N-acetyltransferase [Phycisphaerae bacterium]
MIRNAKLKDVPIIRELINSHAERSRMLFRTEASLYESIRGFFVYELEGKVVGCCALQIIWGNLAEVRSLAVADHCQGKGIGSKLVHAMIAEGKRLELPKIFTLTLEPDFFQRQGFKIVPMADLPMKVWSDCIHCPHQDNCDEIALIHELK